MGRLVGTRFGEAVLALVFLASLLFILVRLTGDPATYLTGPTATVEQKERLRRELGLDQPLTVQYGRYMSNLARGDLGLSYRYEVPVMDLVLNRLPNTLILAGSALLITLVIAVPLGVYSAYWRGSPLDVFARGVAGLGQAVPSFWFGLLLIMVFSIRLKWLPSGGKGGLAFLVLPTIALAFEPISRLLRLLRSSVIEELNSNYVAFHRIKGLPEWKLLSKHVLRNSGLTALTFVGIMAVGFLTGSVLVESVFGWPGIGRLLVESIENRDFNTAQGVALLIGAAFIIGSLFVDLLYITIDPRLRRR